MAAVVMNRITKTDEATVTKMIVLSCHKHNFSKTLVLPLQTTAAT